MVRRIKHSVDRFVIVRIFIPKLRLILILNSFLGSSDSLVFFFFSSRRRHTRSTRDWSSDVCSSDLAMRAPAWGKKLADEDFVVSIVHHQRAAARNSSLYYLGRGVGRLGSDIDRGQISQRVGVG